MARTTRRELEALFSQLMDAMRERGVDTTGYALSTWSPGDGFTRYSIESDRGSGHPLGSASRGAAEMASALRLAFQAMALVPTATTTRRCNCVGFCTCATVSA